MGDGRLVKEHPLGFKVVKPEGVNPIPLFCPVCSLPMLTSTDAQTHRKHQCCASCALRWVDLDREGWTKGWRPNDAEVQREVRRRHARAKTINL